MYNNFFKIVLPVKRGGGYRPPTEQPKESYVLIATMDTLSWCIIFNNEQCHPTTPLIVLLVCQVIAIGKLLFIIQILVDHGEFLA